MEEVRIANFLYMYQIEYEYEPIYQYPILDANKPYTPDFRIKQGNKISYIEHFGITEAIVIRRRSWRSISLGSTTKSRCMQSIRPI